MRLWKVVLARQPVNSWMRFSSVMLTLVCLVGCTALPPSITGIGGKGIFSDRCYDRARSSQLALVDSHVHFRPFGGPTLPFEDMVRYLERAGIRYANVYGIGQVLPTDSGCSYYLDCPGVPVTPSLRNDFINALGFETTKSDRVELILSMTFPDLANPQSVLEGMAVLDREFPGAFRWMGEVNLVKQALFGNGHVPVPVEVIADWAPFMKILKERGMPLAIHADLGSDEEPTKYLALMEEVLRLYPKNKIVWMHLGLSKELTRIDPNLHIQVMQDWLDAYPLLMIDLSWRVVEDAIFSTSAKRSAYLSFLHRYSDRLLPGTDFVASAWTPYELYRAELEYTSRIFRHLDDSAFRNIALGENYFRFLGLDESAPELCSN